jgi:hypothetical protein
VQTPDGSTPPPQQSADHPSVGSALGGALGGKLGIGRKKSSSDQPPPNSQDGQGGGSLLEMTTELSSFSSNSVDASQFEVPAGFKKVDSAMKKQAGR